jgi:outer membrane protein
MNVKNYAMFFGLSLMLLHADEPLTLTKAYEQALINDPKLGASVLKSKVSEEYVNQARSRLYPQLQGSFSWGRYEYDADYLHEPVKENYKSYSISANQPLFHPESWLAVDEAKSKATAGTFQIQADTQKLALDVAKAYFDYIRTRQNIELLQSKYDYNDKKYHQLDEMLKVGLTNRIDFLDAKIHKDKSESELLNERKKLKLAALKLKNYINADITEIPNIDITLLDAKILFKDRPYWEEKLLLNPSLNSSNAMKESTLYTVSKNEYDHLPKVDLSLSRKETFSQDYNSHKYDNQAIVQVSIPIYQGGYTQSKVRESLLLAQAAQKEYSSTQNDVELNFESFWTDYELNIESLKLYQMSEVSANLFLESVEKGSNAGIKSVIDVLDAKAKLYEIKLNTVDTIYKLADNYLKLLDLTGQLNSENIANLENMIMTTKAAQ